MQLQNQKICFNKINNFKKPLKKTTSICSESDMHSYASDLQTMANVTNYKLVNKCNSLEAIIHPNMISFISRETQN